MRRFFRVRLAIVNSLTQILRHRRNLEFLFGRACETSIPSRNAEPARLARAEDHGPPFLRAENHQSEKNRERKRERKIEGTVRYSARVRPFFPPHRLAPIYSNLARSPGVPGKRSQPKIRDRPCLDAAVPFAHSQLPRVHHRPRPSFVDPPPR